MLEMNGEDINKKRGVNNVKVEKISGHDMGKRICRGKW